MITIIHGDDAAASRKYFIDLRNGTPDAVSLQGDKITLTDLAQAVTSGGLFTTERAVFIEQLLTRKKSIELDALIEEVKKRNDISITLWDGKALTKTVTNQFRGADIKEFSFPQVMFRFLDSLQPGNGPQLVKLYHELLTATEPEMVFFMLTRQFRLLLNVFEQNNAIDEVRRLADWQRLKVQKQADQFTQKQLLTIYNEIYRIEVGAKTGQLHMPISHAIDIFLLNI